jgi:hypothetical protein
MKKRAAKFTKTKRRNAKRPQFTVEFEKKELKYRWRAWFRNPRNQKLLKVQSSIEFDNLKRARENFFQSKRFILLRLASNAVLLRAQRPN